MLDSVEWGEYRLGDLFEIHKTKGFNHSQTTLGNDYDYITRTSLNQGIYDVTGTIKDKEPNPAGVWSLGLLQMDFFYRKRPWYASQFMRMVTPKKPLSDNAIMFFTVILNGQKDKLLQVLVRNVDETFRKASIMLPTRDGAIDYEFMEHFVIESTFSERMAKGGKGPIFFVHLCSYSVAPRGASGYGMRPQDNYI